MESTTMRRLALVAVMAAGAATAACSDTPTEPGDDDINPGLLEAGGDMGLSSGAAKSLPQGQGSFDGPDGLDMDATAHEFIQQLTLSDGTVLKTSGVSVRAVPDESVTSPPFHSMVFGSALTGSHASVAPGSYAIMPEWPAIDFVEVVPVTHGRIDLTAGPGGTQARASSGLVTITSISYFPDVYPCEDEFRNLVIDRCDYQVGAIQGAVEMRVTTPDGEIVQQHTPFTLPIKRQTIVARTPTQNP